MNEILYDKLIIHPIMIKTPLSEQSEMIRCFSEVLEQIKEEMPYATVQQLLDASTAE